MTSHPSATELRLSPDEFAEADWPPICVRSGAPAETTLRARLVPLGEIWMIGLGLLAGVVPGLVALSLLDRWPMGEFPTTRRRARLYRIGLATSIAVGAIGALIVAGAMVPLVGGPSEAGIAALGRWISVGVVLVLLGAAIDAMTRLALWVRGWRRTSGFYRIQPTNPAFVAAYRGQNDESA